MHDRIDVRTLGEWQVSVAGTGSDVLRRRTLLLSLVTYISAEGRASRDEIMALFWPESDPDSARRSLNQALYLIRRELGSGAIETDGPVLRAGERLNSDLSDFFAAIEEGNNEGALALLRGKFVPESIDGLSAPFEEWGGRVASRLRRSARAVRSQAVSALRKAARYEEALAAATAWVEEDPLDDEANHEVIDLLARLGRRGAAIEHFERYRGLLNDELEIEPLEDTVDLAAGIRLAIESGVGSPLPSHPPPPVRRLGWAGTAVVAVVGVATLGIVSMTRAPEEPTPVPDPMRIAVLEFDDQSTDSSLGVVARGLTRGLIAELTGAGPIQVVPYHGVVGSRWPGSVQDPLLSAFGVGTVVVGEVQPSGGDVVATVRIIDVATSAYAQDGVVRRPQTEPLELQRSLAELVALLLREGLGDRVRLAEYRGATDSEAWLATNQARDQAEHLWRAHGQIPDHRSATAGLRLSAAERLLDEATSADGDWFEPRLLQGQVAYAKAKLADQFRGGETYLALLDSARVFGEAAAALVPDLAEPRAFVGQMWYERARALRVVDSISSAQALQEARSHLQRALEMNPNDPAALEVYSALRRMDGEPEEAAQLALRAEQADVFATRSPEVLHRLFIAHLDSEEFAEAHSAATRGARLYPDDPRWPTAILTLASWTGTHLPSKDSVASLLASLEIIDPTTHEGLEREYGQVYRKAQAAAVLARLGDEEAAALTLDSLARIVRQTPAWRAPFAWDEAHLSLLLGDSVRASGALAAWIESNSERGEMARRHFLFRDLIEFQGAPFATPRDPGGGT